MKRKKAPRVIALLLALAMLFVMTSQAEVVISGDELSGTEGEIILEGGEDLSLEGGDLALPEGIVDVSTDVVLEDLGLDLEADDLSDDALSDTENKQISDNSSTIVLGVKEKYALDASSIGSGREVTFKSSNKKVATVTSKGVIKGVKKGSATITCRVSSKKVATFKVKVVAAPKKVTLDKTSITLGVKETFTVTPSIADGTHASFTWSSKDKKIATVSSNGKITGKKAGKTIITVETQTGVKATVKVTVKKAPGSVTLSKTSASLKLGGTLQLKATLPDNTYSPITWSSGNSSVATVSDTGKVTAVGVGTATIKARTFNNHTAACKVTVKKDGDGETKCRALLIGEVEFYGASSAYRNAGDLLAMKKMLRSVKGPTGGTYTITERKNLTASQVLRAISNTFADADEDDVSLFFIATHGDYLGSGEDAGALAMSSGEDLQMKTLANALKAVPGKVIVLLESCGAGAAVSEDAGNVSNNSSDRKSKYEKAKAKTKAFDAAVVRAFSSADIGVKEAVEGADTESGGVQSNTLEFRVSNKFYVLTASRYQELSWGWEGGNAEESYNYFTLWLTEGIGITRRIDGTGFDVSSSMPADTNNNGQTTLNELYRFISDVGDNYPLAGNYQHVQVYPANSEYVLFCK